jgi:hypothetical protein
VIRLSPGGPSTAAVTTPHCECPITTTSRRRIALPRLDAADLGRRIVPGDSNDEEVAESLIEDQFRRHPRVGAPQHDGARLLAVGQRDALRRREQR